MSSYTSKQFLLFDSSSDANFRSWGSAISAAIAAMGWTKTTDTTGQVDWATVSAPAAGTFVWEVWSPGDGGTAFRLKVEYSKTSGSPAAPRIRMSLGTSSNGSGTLTGFVIGAMEPSYSNINGFGTVTLDCYFSGDTDRMSMLLWRGNTGSCFIFSVERTKNADGSNSNDGVNLIALRASTQSPTTTCCQTTIVFGVGVANATSGGAYISLHDGKDQSEQFFGTIPMSPIFPDYGKYGNPLTTLGFVHTQDVAEACFFTTTLYGASRTYIATANCSISAPQNCKVCMRYD